jgi:hypothetical protein
LLGVGIDGDGVGIGILAHDTSVQNRSIPVQDCVLLFWSWTGIDIFFIPIPD